LPAGQCPFNSVQVKIREVRETPDFISPDQWPPNSPDMNPVDYKIWAVMQERVYEKRVFK